MRRRLLGVIARSSDDGFDFVCVGFLFENDTSLVVILPGMGDGGDNGGLRPLAGATVGALERLLRELRRLDLEPERLLLCEDERLACELNGLPRCRNPEVPVATEDSRPPRRSDIKFDVSGVSLSAATGVVVLLGTSVTIRLHSFIRDWLSSKPSSCSGSQ